MKSQCVRSVVVMMMMMGLGWVVSGQAAGVSVDEQQVLPHEGPAINKTGAATEASGSVGMSKEKQDELYLYSAYAAAAYDLKHALVNGNIEPGKMAEDLAFDGSWCKRKCVDEYEGLLQHRDAVVKNVFWDEEESAAGFLAVDQTAEPVMVAVVFAGSTDGKNGKRYKQMTPVPFYDTTSTTSSTTGNNERESNVDKACVMMGAKMHYESLKEQVREALGDLEVNVEEYKLSWVGFSFGAATAQLAAADLLTHPIPTLTPTTTGLYTFSSPRVGNTAFTTLLTPLTEKTRYVHSHDWTSFIPPSPTETCNRCDPELQAGCELMDTNQNPTWFGTQWRYFELRLWYGVELWPGTSNGCGEFVHISPEVFEQDLPSSSTSGGQSFTVSSCSDHNAHSCSGQYATSSLSCPPPIENSSHGWVMGKRVNDSAHKAESGRSGSD